MKRLEGKTAMNFGTARGIGRGCAEARVVEGARAALPDIDFAWARQSPEEIALAWPAASSLGPANLTAVRG